MADTFIEGTWDEIVAFSPKFTGQRLRVTLLPEQEEKQSETTPKNKRPIREILAEFAASVPEEELAKVPADFTEQLDHYIYGTPKK